MTTLAYLLTAPKTKREYLLAHALEKDNLYVFIISPLQLHTLSSPYSTSF